MVQICSSYIVSKYIISAKEQKLKHKEDGQRDTTSVKLVRNYYSMF